jgi:hypothetical protein
MDDEPLFGLDGTDIDRLRRVLADAESTLFRGNEFSPTHKLPSAIEVYLAVQTGTITARVGSTFGSGPVEIYALVENSDGSYSTADQGIPDTAYNATTAAIGYSAPSGPSLPYLVVVREPFSGRLLIVQDSQASDTYLAITTSPITARVGSQFGQGTAELQRIPDGLLTDAGTAVEIYSPFYHNIPTGTLVELNRDESSGNLYVVWPDILLDGACIAGVWTPIVSFNDGATWQVDPTRNFGCMTCSCGSGSGSGSGSPCPDCTDYPQIVCVQGVWDSILGPACDNVSLPRNSLDPPSDCIWGVAYNTTACGYQISFGCSGFGVGWDVSYFSGDALFAAYYAPSWDGVSPLTLTFKPGGTCVGCPSTVTVTAGPCGGSGSGSGGGSCSQTVTQLAHGSNTGTTLVIAVPGTVPVGALLTIRFGVVVLQSDGDGAEVAVELSSIGAMSQAAMASNNSVSTIPAVNVLTYDYRHVVTTPLTGQSITVIIDVAGFIAGIVTQVTQAPLVDCNVDTAAVTTGNGVSSTYDLTFSVPTTGCDYSEAAFMLVFLASGGTPTWLNGYTDTGDVSGVLSALNLLFITGDRMNVASGTSLRAEVNGSNAQWAGVQVPYTFS